MSQKKIISLTIPPDLADRVDQRVEETGAKSRSAFITELIEQHLSGQVVALTDEEFEALEMLGDTLHQTPSDIVRFVLDHLTPGLQEVKERVDKLPVMPPVVPTD
jgi:metal-responsive CopG/Arc/MetJ family transcriptional regulator